MSRAITWMMPPAGMASSAPRKPKSSTPISTLMRTASGLSLTVRDMIVTWSTWFSNCWYTTKKTIAVMPAGTECRNANRIVGMAPRVAPMSGMRSAKPTNSPSVAA